MKRGVSGMGKKPRDAALNAKRMYEEAQMVRRVKAYLAKKPVILDEEALHKMSMEVESPPQGGGGGGTMQLNVNSGSGTLHKSSLSTQNSSASLGSTGVSGGVVAFRMESVIM